MSEFATGIRGEFVGVTTDLPVGLLDGTKDVAFETYKSIKSNYNESKLYYETVVSVSTISSAIQEEQITLYSVQHADYTTAQV